MPNYKESQISGDSWVRAKRVILENPLGGAPSATFIEEQVISTAGGDVKLPVEGPVLTDSMTDPTTTFNLLNPADDSVIGTMNYGELYIAVYSLHRHLAAIRDAAP